MTKRQKRLNRIRGNRAIRRYPGHKRELRQLQEAIRVEVRATIGDRPLSDVSTGELRRAVLRALESRLPPHWLTPTKVRARFSL